MLILFLPSQQSVWQIGRVGDLTDDRHRKNELYNVAEARLLEALQLDPVLLTPDGESYYGTLAACIVGKDVLRIL